MRRLKMKFQQAIPEATLLRRLDLARLYVDLTHVMHQVAFPGRPNSGSDLELLMVLLCVFIGDAEGRQTTVSKIAAHAGMPRPNVYRRLEELCEEKWIVRTGRTYHIAQGAARDDPRLDSMIAKYLEK
jgi:hypothetical protein